MIEKRLLVDVSSILWAALFAGEDKENGFVDVTEGGKTVKVNSWQFGLQNALNSYQKTLKDLDIQPKDTILVLDGTNGKAYRSSILPTYKDGRDKSEGQYREYAELQRQFIKIVRLHGGHSVTHWAWEADDVLVALAQSLKPDTSIIWSRDKDLLAAVEEPFIFFFNGELNPDKFDGLPFEFIDLYKSTVGDTSDNIQGATGFGPKAFKKVWETFGEVGMKELRRMISSRTLMDLQEDVTTIPALQKLIDCEAQVYKSWKVAQLYPQKVDLFELQWAWGVNAVHKSDLNVPQLEEYSQKTYVVSNKNHKEVFGQLLSWAEENPGAKISFDIETSTPEESDEWVKLNSERGKGFLDQFGSELTGFSMTWGLNNQFTMYVDVDHLGDKSVPKEYIVELFEKLNPIVRFVAHNAYFENTVMKPYLGFWFHDFDDTMMMSSYVDENSRHGLKYLSKNLFGYDQVSYDAVTQGRKMCFLTLEEAADYGMDDTIMTAGLVNVFEIILRMEGTYETYRQVELGALMMKCQAFLDGITIDMGILSELTKRDRAELDSLQLEFEQCLINMGWDGSTMKEVSYENYKEPSNIKYWASIAGGMEFKSARRKFESLILELKNHPNENINQLGDMLESLDSQSGIQPNTINDFLRRFFSGRPNFNIGSPKQVQGLLYDTLGLPVRLRNASTENQRARGEKGSPKVDALAIETALTFDVEKDSENERLLKTLARIKSLETRFNLFYSKYYTAPHWKDGKLHSFIRQSSTNTRRDSSAQTNLQQLPKGKKGDLRRILAPHHKKAMVVSLDFNAQELRVIADYGRDPNLVACYIGENKEDMHGLTAAKMLGVSYEHFKTVHSDEDHPDHKYYDGIRKQAKIVNFSSEYGVQAPTMSQYLKCSEETAQRYLDAKFETFAGSEEWKIDVIAEAHKLGYVTTKMGARRHLREDLQSSNKWERMKAERQAVNYKIQGSSAEMTKMALGRMWEAKLTERYDLVFYAPIHDEVVFSVAIDDMPEAVCELHKLMIAQYADMWIPVESSVAAGPNFGDQYEMGDVDVNPENVVKFVQHILSKEAEKSL